MSFQGATKSCNIDKRYTTLKLVGGNDCVPGRQVFVPDLDVLGGARIRKTLCANDISATGNVSVSGNLSVSGGVMIDNIVADDICTTTLKVDTITSNVVMQDDLLVTGNLTVMGNTVIDELTDVVANSLIADFVCADSLKVDTITSANNEIIVEGDVTVNGDITAENGCFDDLKANSLVVDGNATVTGNLEVVGNIIGFTPVASNAQCIIDDNGDTRVCANDDDTVTFKIGGNDLGTLSSNGSFAYGTGASASGSNSHAIGENATAATDNSWIFSDGTAASTTAPGEFQVNASGGANFNANVCVNGNLTVQGTVTDKLGTYELSEGTLCVAEIQADTITDKSGGDIILNANGVVDVFCGNVSNVQALFVDQMFGKASPINFEDNINIRDDHKITFEDEGIKIGDFITSGLADGAIAVGKNSVADGSINPLAIGTDAIATGNSSIAIGPSTRADADRSLSVGFNPSGTSRARSEDSVCLGTCGVGENSNNSVAIGGGIIGSNSPDCLAVGSEAYVYAGQQSSVCIGKDSRVSGNVTVCIGEKAFTKGNNCIAIGTSSLAEVQNSIAVGLRANAQDNRAVVVGNECEAVEEAISIGNFGYAVGTRSVCAGYQTRAQNFGVSIGNSCDSFRDECYLLGSELTSCGENTILIGKTISSPSDVEYVIGIGSDIGSIGGQNAIAIGREVTVANAAANAIVVGTNASVLSDAEDCIAIGVDSEVAASANSCISIGKGASSAGTGSIAIGVRAQTFLDNQIAIGTDVVANSSVGVLFLKHRATSSTGGNDARWNGDELFESTSSQRFKQNIRDLESISGKIDAARPVRYNPKEGYGDEDEECIGLIAEEFAPLFPELVNYEDDGTTPKGISYSMLSVVLLKEVQNIRQILKDNGLINV